MDAAGESGGTIVLATEAQKDLPSSVTLQDTHVALVEALRAEVLVPTESAPTELCESKSDKPTIERMEEHTEDDTTPTKVRRFGVVGPQDKSDDEAHILPPQEGVEVQPQSQHVGGLQHFTTGGRGNSQYNAQMQHFHFYPSSTLESSAAEVVGIQFSLVDNTRRSEELTLTRQDRYLAFTKRHQVVSYLPEHSGAYQTLDTVKSPQIRYCLYRIAHFFLRLDKVFAALFVEILQAEDHHHLSILLNQVRHEITERHTKDRIVTNEACKVFIGDLGRHCELLLEQHKDHSTSESSESKTAPLKFQVSHGADEYLLAYLQNGFEVPYWRIMLDTFFTFRANRTTMGTDVLSLALHHMKSEVRVMRRQLQQLLDALPAGEDIEGILCGLDKRIEVLHSFTDSTISSAEEDYKLFDFMISRPVVIPDRVAGDPDVTNAEGFDKPVQPSPWHTALTMLTMLAAAFPFLIGFAISYSSKDLGKPDDADFWYNVSSCTTVILGNFTMIFPLLKGFWFSAQYMIMWLWFSAGIAFSGLSIGLYSNHNTCWSSACAFMATISGFAASLNVTMTVGKDQHKPKKLKPD